MTKSDVYEDAKSFSNTNIVFFNFLGEGGRVGVMLDLKRKKVKIKKEMHHLLLKHDLQV